MILNNDPVGQLDIIYPYLLSLNNDQPLESN